MTRKTVKQTRSTETTYRAVSNNVYFDGSSYRVRMSIDGIRYSKNFSSKKAALQFRGELLKRVNAQ